MKQAKRPAGRGGYVKNTVAGSRRGSKWPEKTKTAALADLMVEPNIHTVSKRYGVPESTLRGWLKTEKKRKKESAAPTPWEQRRDEVMAGIAKAAAQHAQLAVEGIGRRVELSNANFEKIQAVREEFAKFIEDPGGCDGEQLTAKIIKMEQFLYVAGDYPLANYLRALIYASQRAQSEGENEGVDVINVVLKGGAEKLAE